MLRPRVLTLFLGAAWPRVTSMFGTVARGWMPARGWRRLVEACSGQVSTGGEVNEPPHSLGG